MIDNKTVHYVAALARLHIGDAQADHFAKNLADILRYVEKLNKLDVSGIKPTSHVLEVENVTREDEILPSLPHNEALSFAIEKHDNFFRVPKVIE